VQKESLIIKQGDIILGEVQLPLLEQVLIFGQSQLTTQAIRACLWRDIPIAYLSRMGYCYGRILPIARGYRQLSRYQQQLSTTEQLITARAIVQGKLKNSRILLRRQRKRLESANLETVLQSLDYLAVTFLQTGERILHIEFQTIPQSKPPIPFRELDYSVRLKRQYDLRVTQVVIFLQPTNDPIAYTDEYRDETTVHKYQVIRMWEQNPELFLNSEALLPLAPLAATSSPEALLSQVVEKIATIPNRGDRQNIAGYTQILAGLKFDKAVIRNLLSEDIMKESVIYQDILQKGQKEGEKLGEKNEALRLLSRLLNRKYGTIDSSIIERVQSLTTEQLEQLAEDFIDFSNISDLEAWLNK
jgi:predicted transposase YdaD